MERRLSYEETCQDLLADGLIDEVQPLPKRMPRYDDDPCNWYSFKNGWQELDLANLTLTRTFLGRSLFEQCNFSNTDWRESRMCWNDFHEVDFSHADLSGADQRRSAFTSCDFGGAVLTGAKVTYSQAKALGLTEEQCAQVRWYRSPGSEPAGG